jgi:hypothetical protein
VLQRPALARPLLGEEGQLPAARVRADQGERVGSLDDMHAGTAGQEIRDPVAVRDPERDVVECLGIHAGEHR